MRESKKSKHNEILYQNECPFCIMGKMHKYLIWRLVKDLSVSDLREITKKKQWYDKKIK